MNIKQFFYKLRQNPFFRLSIYILIEIALLVITTLTMDFSIGYAAPVTNCLCFLFIAFEIVFFHNQFILPFILVLKIVTLLVCNYFVGSLNYIIVFSVCFLLLKISDFIIHNKHNLREFTFPMTRKELFRRSLSKYNSSFIVSQLVILAVCYFTQKSLYELVIPCVFIVATIYKDWNERKWGKKYNFCYT